MSTKKLTILSLLLGMALILSYIESLIPYNFVIPGIKIGLCNIAIIFTLYKLGIKEAFIVSLLRVLIMGILFNNGITFIYSLIGAILSLFSMYIIKRFNLLDEYGVCITGAIFHNIGQLLAAYVLLNTSTVIYYLPYLLLSGVITGFIIGTLAYMMIKRVNI